MSSRSASFTEACSPGSSRNHQKNRTAQTSPSPQNTKNDARQPSCSISQPAITDEHAAPSCIAVSTIPCTTPRSDIGNQRATTRALFGKAPASPAPNRNRTISNSRKLSKTSGSDPASQGMETLHPLLHENLSTQPVSTVKIDHQVTIRVNTPREPYRSPQRPVGTSNRP